MAGWLQVAAVIALVGALHVPLGDYMARVFTARRHWRAETVIYRLGGMDPDTDQPWPHYIRSLLATSVAGIVGLYLLLRLQGHLPYSLGHPGMSPALAFDTAVSFTTNTSWQNYAGESTLGYLAQAAGLGVEAFLSAAVGLAAVLALIRGIVRRETDRVGNFWVDLTRAVIRVLLPLAAGFAVLLAGLGVIENLGNWQVVTTLAGGRQAIPGGLVASWEPIKLISGDGGGFFNANSAHPFENPGPLTNVIEITLMLLVPVACIRMFGRLAGDRRQGWALLAVAGVLFTAWMAITIAAESQASGTAPAAAHAAMEGKQTAFGVPGSAAFGVAATSSADGAANASYDSFTALGGGMLLSAMLLGEVSPGGVGSGLYGLLMVAVIGVFLGGLMISRTPEYLRKRIRAPEMRMVALYYLATPLVLLAGTAVAIALPAGRAAILNPGAHGLSEVLYAFTSSANSNGSAFGGLSGNTTFYNTLLAVVMLLGRYAPMVFVLGLAGSLARQRPTSGGAGTLRTSQPAFVALLIGVAVVLVFLTFLPALALGPLAEGLH
ncbi:MAG: potassium-transporting ATPase potassium-binding subunit [Streptosporangiaceae bacterium]|jgi:K+-transporting ATPase ATPase A chain|nr:potassium-transporting ATPase potassium-binding subunit [Streptosporangiaceae bacterium]